jgi:hypothetical protein
LNQETEAKKKTNFKNDQIKNGNLKKKTHVGFHLLFIAPKTTCRSK